MFVEKIGDIVKSIIPTRKDKDVPQTNNAQTIQVQQVQPDPQKTTQTELEIPIKKIIIIALIAIGAFFGVVISGATPLSEILPVNLFASQDEETELEIMGYRVTALEEQVDFIIEREPEKGEQGPQGERGAQGIQGPPGPMGEKGLDGSSSIPMMFNSGERKTQLTRAFYIGSGGGADDFEITSMISPTNGFLKNLHVWTSDDPGNEAYAVLVINGEETNLSCSIFLNECNNNTTIIEIKAGDLFAVKIDKNEQIPAYDLFRAKASLVLDPEI